MTETMRTPINQDAGAVVERVLEAERSAEAALSQARAAGEALIAAAHAREEAIRRRGDDRISRLHVALKGRVDAEIERLKQGAAASDVSPAGGQPVAIDPRSLARAVERLAAKLTGQDHENGS